MSEDDLRYGYAVCRPFDTPLPTGLTGVAGAPVALLRHGDLVAVTSAVPEQDFSERALRARLEDLDWLAATARAHDEVLAALTRVTSPLPLRLATVFRGADGVRTMLAARHDELRRHLARLDGCVEWGVKVYTQTGGAEEDGDGTAGGAATAGRAAGGRDYLRRRRMERASRERVWEHAEEFAARLQHGLARYAADVRVHRPQDARLSGAPGRNVLNAAYLVDRDRSEEFTTAVRQAGDEARGLRVELTGPWAAYSFGDPPADASREDGAPARTGSARAGAEAR
ncbi:GvpL/GvpF family gas vesicle protein [Streptomyces odontomachi]|uniref:GvpL/GvpF family gas vesicle protein n=1 Tax=Streptomyces odontomachi TaxID=2944940 RepID=UPI00210E2310|nr:GvpL/GvpF family gas vesicle protein [Streptomyces sp. ODS25]